MQCCDLCRCECGHSAALYAEGRTSTPRWCGQCPGRPQHGCLYIAGERCECGSSVACFADAGLEEGYQLHGMRFCLNPPMGNRLARYCKDCPKLKQLEAVDTIWEICGCETATSSETDIDLTPPDPLQLPQKPELPSPPDRAPDPPDMPMPTKEPPVLEEEPPEWAEPIMQLPKVCFPARTLVFSR